MQNRVLDHIKFQIIFLLHTSQNDLTVLPKQSAPNAITQNECLHICSHLILAFRAGLTSLHSPVLNSQGIVLADDISRVTCIAKQ